MIAAETNTFTVIEALPKDAGRGLARLDPADFNALGINAGDAVWLQATEGEARKTVAKVMPCYPDERGKGIVQLDAVTRQNVGIDLNALLHIEKAAAVPAQQLTLLPISNTLLSGSAALGAVMQGAAVVAGDRIQTRLLNGKQVDFTVVSTVPQGAVVITPSTVCQLEVKKNRPAPRRAGRADTGGAANGTSASLTYADIGGLGKELARIREIVELPLRYPEVFERLGIRPPKGVLLTGAPGTGKTLIAKAVAGETDAYFIAVSAPEIMGKLYGESESRLRAVFDDAKRHAPAIIFIDEIDAIAPKRDDLGSEKQVEKRVVAQLLALMDGIDSKGSAAKDRTSGQIIVIGATNIPNALDAALRRPGRFDREIAISIPDKTARREILDIHTRLMPLDESVNLDAVAALTHGYVGADLESLAREAAMAALRTALPELSVRKFSADADGREPGAAALPDVLNRLTVTAEHFIEAMRDVQPSAIREFFVEVPDVGWEEVGGLERVKEALREAIEYPLKFADVFAAAGATPPKGILLYGAPGTGKTLLAKAAATATGANFIAVQGAGLMSRFLGESEKAIRELFKVARAAAPTLLFIDEVDALLPARRGNATDTQERVVSQFLIEMDGAQPLTGVVVLGATNRIDLLDSAMLRGGRFEMLLEIELPDRASRQRIFEIHTRKNPLDSSVHLPELAAQTEGFVGADIEFVCKKAATLSVRDYLIRSTSSLTADSPVLTKAHFDAALAQVKSQKRA